MRRFIGDFIIGFSVCFRIFVMLLCIIGPLMLGIIYSLWIWLSYLITAPIVYAVARTLFD